MTHYLYRVEIIYQPEWEQRWCFATRYSGLDEETETYEDFFPCPVGWEPHEEYIERFGSDRWIEPALDKAWRSRSSAAMRRDILNAAGYIAIVQRSAPIQWPGTGRERVNDSEFAQVAQAIKVLKRAGLIKSADEILK